MHFFKTKYAKIELVRYYRGGKQKNVDDPKIETVKYLELINQNKIGLIFGTASKLCKFCGHASGHSTFKTPFYEIGVQILPKITRKKKLNLPQESTEVNTCYHDVLHLTVLGHQMEKKCQ